MKVGVVKINYMKLVYKILLAIILPTIIISLIFILVIRNNLFNEVESRFFNSIEKSTQDYSSLLEVKLSSISNIANSHFINHLKNIDNLTEEDVFKILENSLDNDTLIYGASVKFDAAFNGNLRASLLYAYRDKGSYNRIYLKNNTTKYNNYFSNSFDWWTIPKNTGKDLWTSPYFDEGVGNSLMITYAHPFYNNNTFNGITSIDIRLKDITKLLLINEKSIDGQYDPNLFILNTTDSVIIYSENKERIGNFAFPQNQIPENSINIQYNFLDSIFSYKNKTGFIKGEYSNQTYFAFYSRIKHTNWLILIILPLQLQY